jgi:serine/threonine protein kinase
VWSDQLVAIKIPNDPQYIRNLQREGVAIHGLSHPNIVRALGFDPYGDPPYLVMEYVPGTSLRPVIEAGKRSAEDAIEIMRQVLSALAYAHKNNLIHRDIKPENILVHERVQKEGFGAPGVIKVTDFGLGKVAAISKESIAFSASMAGPDAKRISGTLDYMSPEQRAGADVDGRTDLYACGIVLFELLTGERPAGTDVPSDLNRDVPKYLDDVFRRSYSRLEKRFASADEFLAALKAPASPPPLRGQLAPPPLPLRPEPSGPNRICPNCQWIASPEDQFCMHCGKQLVGLVLRCPQCGAYPDPSDRFCIFCGVALSPHAMA